MGQPGDKGPSPEGFRGVGKFCWFSSFGLMKSILLRSLKNMSLGILDIEYNTHE
jgi:hypothetical protein